MTIPAPTRPAPPSRPHPRTHVPFAVLLATAVVSMGFGAIFALLPDYQKALHFEPWGLGVVTSASFVAGFTAQFGLSRFADRGWGRRMLVGGVALAGVGCAGIALAPSFALLVVARIVLGFGEGIYLPAARKVVITRNPHAVGAALGRLGATATGGFLVGPPFAAFVASWTTVRVPFFVLALALATAAPAIARYSVPEETHAGTPRALRTLIRLAGVRRALFLGLGFACAIGVYDSLWARFLKDLGASTRFVSVSLTIFAAPIALLASRAGRMADRYGAQRVGSLGAFCSAPFIAAYGFISSYWAIAFIALGHSVFDSAIAPSSQAQMARSTPTDLVASGQGLLDGTALLGAAVSAAISAPLYAQWGAAALWVGLASAVGLFAFLAARPVRAAAPSPATAAAPRVA
jgi:predicted MFS family arabinose efflux permease